MKMKQTTLDKMGQKLALAEINIHRVKAGKKPATRVTKLWWQIYGNEYRAKASAIAMMIKPFDRPLISE